MQSLTDRMAAALRDVIAAGVDHDDDLICELLIEYDAERGRASAFKVPQPRQRVRCLGKPDEPQWRGVVLYTKYDTVAIRTDDGGELISMADELEIQLNLPAANTGD